MKVIRLELGQLQTNCYIVICEETKEAIVIDPADEGGFIAEKILSLGLRPMMIVATHGHFDHVLGLLELKLAFNLPFAIHPDDEFLLKQARQSALHWLKRQVDPVPMNDTRLSEGEEIKFGKEKLKVMHTPGHTPGSVSLYNEKDKILFSGDTIFAGGAVGRTDFKYSSNKDLRGSIKKLMLLPSETVIYAGHGEESTIGSEKELFA